MIGGIGPEPINEPFPATVSRMLSRTTVALCSAWSHPGPFSPGCNQSKKVERGVLKVTSHATSQWPTILINRHITAPGQLIEETKIEGGWEDDGIIDTQGKPNLADRALWARKTKNF